MLYLLESMELKAISWNRCKVGVSATEYSMIRRMSNHRTSSPVDLDVIYLVPDADIREEQLILTDFSSFRRPGTEWLMASADELIGYIKHVLGFTGLGPEELIRYERTKRNRDQQLDESIIPCDSVGASRRDLDDNGSRQSTHWNWDGLYFRPHEPGTATGG